MISLTDELRKFQRMVYNQDLDQFIAIDDQFMGSGITIQSMVKQNGFIINQMKKLKNIFINYCKLNDKVYKKIQEHQYSIHTEQTKLNQIVGSVDRKTVEVVRDMKNLYEGTIQQNHKSKEVLQKVSVKMNEELKKKVDSTTFTKHIRAIMEDDYQQIEEQLGTDVGTDGISVGGETDNIKMLPIRRKVKGASFEELQKFKTTLIPIVQSAKEQQIQQMTKIQQQQIDIYNLKTTLFKTSKEIDQLKAQLIKINVFSQEQSQKIDNNYQKIVDQMNQRLDPQVWNGKFEDFYKQKVSPKLTNLIDLVNEHFIKSQQNFNKVAAQFRENKEHIKALRQKHQDIQLKFPSIYESIEQNSNQIQTVKEQCSLQFQSLNSQIFNSRNELAEQIHQNKIQNQQQHSFINQKIDNLSLSIEESILKGVNKRFQVQINNIDLQIKEILKKQKEANTKMANSFIQLANIKEILSKKANFSDLLMQVEKKADKTDVREIKDKIEISSQLTGQSKSKKTITIEQAPFRMISERSKKKMNLSRTIMTSFGKPTEDSPSAKIFMCGLDNHTSQIKDINRQCFSSKTRKRSIKSMGCSAILG